MAIATAETIVLSYFNVHTHVNVGKIVECNFCHDFLIMKKDRTNKRQNYWKTSSTPI